MDPLFKYYYREYTKDEFMMDAEVTFTKLKRFLSNDPKVLRDDPFISHEYQNILNMLKRKWLMELCSNEYDPADQEQTVYHDVEEEHRRAEEAVQRMLKSM